jgi:hypothetical protein
MGLNTIYISYIYCVTYNCEASATFFNWASPHSTETKEKNLIQWKPCLRLNELP